MILQWISIMDTGDAIKAADMNQAEYDRDANYLFDG